MPNDELQNPKPGREAETTSDVAEQETLLTMSEGDCKKRLVRDWDASHQSVKHHLEQWRVNWCHDNGYTGVELIKTQDESRAYLPEDAVPNMQALNYAARLKRKMRAVMFADPPLPDGEPARDDDEAKDAAEFATRVLEYESGEGRLSLNIMAADAFDQGAIYGSGFLRFYVDPGAHGWRAREVIAHKDAQTEEDALVDPATGQEREGPFVTRYARKDGSLTDDLKAPDIDPVWLPGLRCEKLTGKNVRFLPPTCNDLWGAEGVQIGAMVPLGTVKSMFPAIAALGNDKLQELVKARPQNAKDLLPRYQKLDNGTLSDETLVFVLTRIHISCPSYPKGCYVILVGDDVLAHRGEWWDAQNNKPLDLPLTQFGHFHEDENPYKRGLMQLLGPGNELLAYLYGGILEHLARFTARKIFNPTTSPLQPEQLQSPTGTVLSILPGQQPMYEEVPEFPNAVKEMVMAVREDLNSESGLEQAAQGMNPPGVKSGLHGEIIIEQVIMGLAELRQNTERALVRAWRIMLQQIRAFYSVKQLVKWQGEDGSYKERAFRGADLQGTEDVKLRRGSFTQMTPSAKLAMAATMAQMQLLQPEEIESLVGANVSGMLGIQDNPHRLRVRRQIAQWRDGPPEGWRPPAPPMPGQQPPADPLWSPRACDVQPDIARIRAHELGRTLAGAKLETMHPAWVQPLQAEYERMRKAAGLLTIEEQSQAQAAPVKADQQLKQADVAIKGEKVKLERQKAGAEIQLEAMKLGKDLAMGNPKPSPEGIYRD